MAHGLLLGPVFLYVGLIADRTPDMVFHGLLAMAALLIIYHAATLLQNKKQFPMVNVFHLAIGAPLMIYLGTQKKESLPQAFLVAIGLGFLLIFGHLLKIWDIILNYKINKKGKNQK